MKYSPRLYYGITVSLYLLNCLSVMPLIFSAKSNQITVMTYINELFLLWKSPIQAIFKFLLPGVLFYVGCNYFQKE